MPFFFCAAVISYFCYFSAACRERIIIFLRIRTAVTADSYVIVVGSAVAEGVISVAFGCARVVYRVGKSV